MDSTDITQLLEAAAAGHGDLDEVFSAVYPRLREIARSRRGAWRGEDTLNTTVLIHEAYLKMRARPDSKYEDRGHFFAVAATAMRQVLINYAERKRAAKRGGGAADVTLQEGDAVHTEALDEILELENALKGLEEISPRQAKVVECLFFAGFTIDETAEAIGTSPATVKRDWTAARTWLFREMHPE